jgi:hypothetical protein
MAQDKYLKELELDLIENGTIPHEAFDIIDS